MKEIVYRNRVVIPEKIMLSTLCYWVHPKCFWYFRCPDKHTRAVVIPLVHKYMDGEKTEKLKYFSLK